MLTVISSALICATLVTSVILDKAGNPAFFLSAFVSSITLSIYSSVVSFLTTTLQVSTLPLYVVTFIYAVPTFLAGIIA